ncbi:MAG: hypothetical protein EOO27_01375, partial [Comamonadaceae bacterium]
MSQQPSPVSPTIHRQASVTATQRDRAALLTSLSQISDVSCAVALGGRDRRLAVDGRRDRGGLLGHRVLR